MSDTSVGNGGGKMRAHTHQEVGIIMYLLASDALQRKEITEEFFNYRSLAQSLWDDYSAYEHWTKIKVPIFTTSFKIYSDIVCVIPRLHTNENSISLVNFKSTTSSLARIPD